MARNALPRRLVVNADDFGRSSSINQAIIRAHQEGILTTASLMVNEVACQEAVVLAKARPTLGVGLHLTLLCGHAALPPQQLPGLVNNQGEFTSSPVMAGCRYFLRARFIWYTVTRSRPAIPARKVAVHASGDRYDHEKVLCAFTWGMK